MSPHVKITKQTESICSLAVQLFRTMEADALLLLLDGPMDWERLRELTKNEKVLLAAEKDEFVAGAAEAEFPAVRLEMPGAPIYEKLTQALLECVADDLLNPGASVVAMYSGFEINAIDSLSLVHLDEHLGRLTVRDLRQLETRVPLDTLKIVVDLAVEIGREGREGKPVGTMFVVGDHRKVLPHCHPAGFDPVRGYNRKERHIADSRVREGLKEIAQMDGAFVITSDGLVERACQIVNAPPVNVTLSKGLGTRHWAAASISKATKAVAIAVSETNGTVRVFQNGEVVLRIEPFRRAMKWKDFEIEAPGSRPPAAVDEDEE